MTRHRRAIRNGVIAFCVLAVLLVTFGYFPQNVLRQYNRALGDASDMVKILQIKPEIKDPARPEKSRIVRGKIELKKMTFAHPESNDDV